MSLHFEQTLETDVACSRSDKHENNMLLYHAQFYFWKLWVYLWVLEHLRGASQKQIQVVFWPSSLLHFQIHPFVWKTASVVKLGMMLFSLWRWGLWQ